MSCAPHLVYGGELDIVRLNDVHVGYLQAGQALPHAGLHPRGAEVEADLPIAPHLRGHHYLVPRQILQPPSQHLCWVKGIRSGYGV